jgi:hypothetical protein
VIKRMIKTRRVLALVALVMAFAASAGVAEAQEAPPDDSSVEALVAQGGRVVGDWVEMPDRKPP